MNEQMNERLLTDEEIEIISKKSISYGTTFHNIAKAQLARDMGWEDRTASIIQAEATAYYEEMLSKAIERLRIVKDTECQQRINNKMLMLAVQLEDRGTWSKDGTKLTTFLSKAELQALKGK